MKIRLAAVLVLFSVAASLPSAAVVSAGGISGYVRDSAGKPQLGAVVEVFTSAATAPSRAFTDAKGFYNVTGLLPGTYFVKASATALLPSLRENILVSAGAHQIVNITLNTLFEALSAIPAKKRNAADDDDWRWTLRSAVNRPILRALGDNEPLVMVSDSDNADDKSLKARVAFLAGSDGDSLSGSDVNTAFDLEQSIFSTGTMLLNGSLDGQANGVVRMGFTHPLPNGSSPRIELIARRFATPDTASHHAAMSAIALSFSDHSNLGEFLELGYGGELQSIQFRGRVNNFAPHASVRAHLGQNTIVEYAYATSLPTMRTLKGFDSAPMDLTETSPRVSLVDDQPQIERSRHQEVSVSQHVGSSSFQAAYFSDRIRNTALTGIGDVSVGSGDFLPDVYASTFNFDGGTLETRGVRLVASRKFSDALTTTVDYAWGGVLALDAAERGTVLDPATAHFSNRYRHAFTGRASGTLPRWRTRWLASYKWSSGSNALTPVDAFNTSPGQSDPFLNLFIRQPIPCNFMPGKMEALVDVRNLLAQGYVPLVGSDGRTLYLVQAPRSLRGGVAFSF